MKVLKLSLIALTFGLFAISCGEGTTNEETTTPEVEVTPEVAPEATPDTVDSPATETPAETTAN